MSLEQRYKEFQETIKEQQKEINKRTDKIFDDGLEIEGLNSKITGLEKENKRLKDEIERKDKLIVDTATVLKEKVKPDYEKQLQEKDKEVERFKGEIERLKELYNHAGHSEDYSDLFDHLHYLTYGYKPKNR